MIHRQELVAPGLVLLVLAVILALALGTAKGRSRWGWGRGQKIPISAPGAVGLVLALLVMSAALLGGALGWLTDGFFVLIGLFSGFILFILSGLLDSWRQEAKQRDPRSGRHSGPDSDSGQKR